MPRGKKIWQRKKQKQEPPLTIHIDTSFIIGLLWGPPDEYEQSRQEIQSLIRDVNEHPKLIQVVISQVVLGEIVVKMHEERPEEEWGMIIEELGHLTFNLNAILKCPDCDAMVLASQLTKNRFDDADALIFAQALSDPESGRMLYFGEKEKLPTLINLEEELRNESKRNRQLHFPGQ